MHSVMYIRTCYAHLTHTYVCTVCTYINVWGLTRMYVHQNSKNLQNHANLLACILCRYGWCVHGMSRLMNVLCILRNGIECAYCMYVVIHLCKDYCTKLHVLTHAQFAHTHTVMHTRPQTHSKHTTTMVHTCTKTYNLTRA